MNPGTKYPIPPFIELGRRLQESLRTHRLDPVIHESSEANLWFTPQSIAFAIEALCTDMLNREALERWLRNYPGGPAHTPRKVGVIMAGNIPFVGFFDLMCVLLSGHTCLYKPSSKDTVLVEFIVGLLREIAPELPIQRMDSSRPEAVIATGSDNTNRYFRTAYHGIPAVFRGSRTSIAILTGNETPAEIAGLGEDMFTYFGMGCRNVSRLFIPEGYPLGILAESLQAARVTAPRYLHNYKQTIALNTMLGQPITDGGFFVFREGGEPGNLLSEIVCTRYRSPDEIGQWVAQHDDKLQCIVSNAIDHPRRVGFGQAQHPRPEDYPDGIDTMNFLLHF